MTAKAIQLTLNVVGANIDRRKLAQAAARANKRALTKVGAFVRRRARSSIRKRKRISRPGQPPSGHTGKLRKLILFGYDPAGPSVVIGPRPTRSGSDAPQALEHGGRYPRSSHGRRVVYRYRARPFMGPALSAEQSNIPDKWRDSVK